VSGAALRSWAAASERLRAPDAPEAFSPLTGEGLLAVDLRGAATGAPAHAAALRALASLPCPTVAVGPEGAGPPGLREGFDVALEDERSLDRIRERVARTPLAALTLVQLLRLGRTLELGEALVAESWAYATLQAGPEFAAWLRARGAPRPAPASDEPPVLARREGGVLTLVLNRPARRNACSSALRDALVEALTVAVADEEVREVVLRGAGAAFCSGGDLDEFGTLPDPATAHAVRSTRSAARLLAACGDRVRACIHGACVGAGAELAAFARRVTAAPDAFFELPELAMGLVPGAGGTASLPRRIGRQRTAWLALSGERIDAHTALRWGLVDEIDEDAAPR
jgi:enoyl-CoA hydratase/carnithine racemase